MRYPISVIRYIMSNQHVHIPSLSLSSISISIYIHISFYPLPSPLVLLKIENYLLSNALTSMVYLKSFQ
jgi:hypothetical protein